MSVWGYYPWRKFEFNPTSVTKILLLRLLLKLPFYVIESVAYLAYKYLQYLPYKVFRNSYFGENKIVFFSPSHHLREFTDRTKKGFWGEVKFLSDDVVDHGLWCLIPYKHKGSSHRKIASEIKSIQLNSKLSVFPLASLFGFGVFVSLVLTTSRLHFQLVKSTFGLINPNVGTLDASVFQNGFFGKNLAQTELNRILIKKFLRNMEKPRSVVTLMEGQSWEIALIIQCMNFNIQCYGVIHTPVRGEDSQILNYFLHYKELPLISHLQTVLCPGNSSVQRLIALGADKKSLVQVEAQRFARSTVGQKHRHAPESKRVLYVADANEKNTDYFLQQIKMISESSCFQFFIQPHPASVLKGDLMKYIWDGSKVSDWRVVLFGPETSAYLQPEFSDSSTLVFGTANDAESPSRLKRISDLNEVTTGTFNAKSGEANYMDMLNVDPEFPLWRATLNDLFR